MLRRFLLICLLSGLSLGAHAEGGEDSSSVLDSLRSNVVDGITNSKAVDGVRNLLGTVASSTKKLIGIEGIPERIAVLPATGEGETSERIDISNALHNTLGTSQFTLLKPHLVEHGLNRLEVKHNSSYQELAPEVIAQELGVDGLLWVNVDQIDKVYAAAYAHYEISVSVRLFDLKQKKDLWKHHDSIIEREGGISLNPLGIIATAVTSAEVLSEATRLQLIDQLARKFSALIPEPKGQKTITPPQIRLAISNAKEGPFRAGDELKVLMEAEPALISEFSLPGKKPIAMSEQSDGNYIGRYVVQPGDKLEDAIVEIKAVRGSDKTTTMWRLSGRIQFDTEKPAALSDLKGRASEQGIQLSWQGIEDSGTEVKYSVERADVADGIYKPLAETAINSYLDQNTEVDHTYVYRVTPQDAAKNKGTGATVTTSIAKPGPTPVTGTVHSTTYWSALGSPYQLSGEVIIGPAAQVIAEPGSIIQLSDGSSLTILGQLDIEGSKDSAVAISGETFNIVVQSSNNKPWQHLKVIATSAQLHLKHATRQVNHGDMSGLDILLDNGSSLTLRDTRLSGAQTALTLDGGQLHLQDSLINSSPVAIDVRSIQNRPAISAENSRLAYNETHIKSQSELTISNVSFAEVDYDTVLAKLEGPVIIDWQSLPEEHNLQLSWLGERWQKIEPLIKKRDWHGASSMLKEAQAADTAGLGTLFGWLASGKVPATAPNSDFLYPAYNALKAGKRLDIWVQPMQVPSNSSLMGSEAVVLQQARSRFGRSYLTESFAHKKRDAAYKKASKLPLHKAIVSSAIGYRQSKGLTTDIWIIHTLNRDQMEHNLSLAGLMHRQRSNLVVAVAVDGEGHQGLKNKLFKLMDKQNIPFIDVSMAAQSNRLATAKQKNADLLLTARLLSDVSTSTLTQNLKVVNADLNIKLESTVGGEVLNRYNRDSRVTAFKASDGLNKAINKTFNGLQERLLMDVYSYQPQ